jgi:sec-independent protein translocase protein TatA
MCLLASLTNLFSGGDLLLILLLILLLFGAKKLPELARGMGQAIREFQKAKDEFTDELHKAGETKATETKPNVQPAQSTVARIEAPAPSSAVRPDPNQTTTPREKSDQV